MSDCAVAQTIRSKCLRILGVALVLACASRAFSQQPADPAAALRARYLKMTDALETSTIQKGLYVESADSSRAPRGDAYAVVNYPFATVAGAFTTPAVLCESLILHINVQYCRAASGVEPLTLSVALGKKTWQPLEDAYHINLDFKAEASADFMRVELTAKDGPLDTGNYLIAMELVALDDQRAFMHIQYAYTQGFMARVATSVYFATNGSEKVGFTRVPDARSYAPQLVRGIRGVLERNTMRYYLAFDAYLHALAVPPAQRFDASLERWFADTERFAHQLREVTHDDYVAMKRRQYLRQRSPTLMARGP